MKENKDPWAEYRPGGRSAAVRRRLQRHRAGHKVGASKPRVYGATRPTSAAVGEGAWALKLNGSSVNAHHKVHHTKFFKNKVSHSIIQSSFIYSVQGPL